MQGNTLPFLDVYHGLALSYMSTLTLAGLPVKYVYLV